MVFLNEIKIPRNYLVPKSLCKQKMNKNIIKERKVSSTLLILIIHRNYPYHWAHWIETKLWPFPGSLGVVIGILRLIKLLSITLVNWDTCF